jgi:hypothetical protein
VLLTKACGCAVTGDVDGSECAGEEAHGSPEGGAGAAAQKGSAPEVLAKAKQTISKQATD